MTSIQAQVNTRLLAKASRLFTGTLAGRIIEILQNARRAGAKHVIITNHNGLVTIRDDGRGITDFAKLLDLGGSGWQPNLESSEDPAGVGLFSLAPRKLTVRSRGHKVVIDESGWTGTPVEVLTDPPGLPICPPDITAGAGTELEFADDPWDAAQVKSRAVFTGLEVVVDNEPCPSERFLTGRAVTYRELGCRIQVVPESAVSHWHRDAALSHNFCDNVLLNFHGQVVAFGYHPTSNHNLHFLVELTGQPTGIRLMLPARTCLVANDAFTQLKAALEREAFLYLKRQRHHRLPYKEYLRAKELGIELPESEPVYRVGLL
ncbi:MAG: ATP-binding protein, partial [Phycisphaerae bacterium]